MVILALQINPFIFLIVVIVGVIILLITIAILLAKISGASSRTGISQDEYAAIGKDREPVAKPELPEKPPSTNVPKKKLEPVVTVQLRGNNLNSICDGFGISEIAIMSKEGLIVESFPKSSAKRLSSLFAIVGDIRSLLSAVKNMYINIEDSMIFITSIDAGTEKFYVIAKVKNEDIVVAAEVFKQLLSLYLSKRITEIKEITVN